MKHELQNIISGKSQVRHGDAIQKVTRYLRGSKSSSRTLTESKSIKRQEVLIDDANSIYFNHL